MTTALARRLVAEAGELLARHDGARDADFSRYDCGLHGLIAFCRDLFRVELWSVQQDIAASVLENTRTCVVSGHSTGKDFFAACLILWWVYAHRGRVVISGPTERQVRGIVMALVRRLWTQAESLPGDLYAQELRISDVTVVNAFTSDNSSRLTGWHHERLLVVLSEAQGCDAEAYEALISCATSPDNRLLFYGNPVAPSGPFYQIAHSDNWRRITIPVTLHPNIISGRMEVPGGPSREWLEYMRDEYGVASPIYQSRVLACFPEEAVSGLYRRQWLQEAFTRHASGALNGQAYRANPLLAVDVARFGADSTCVAVVRGPVVERLLTWRGLDTVATVDRVIAEATQLWHPQAQRAPTIVVDATGVGGGVADQLRAKGWHALDFNGSGAPTDQRMLNARADAHWVLRTLLETNAVALPRDEMLLEEALAVEWTVAPGNGLVQVLSKDNIRSALGRSPDRLDAVTMGLAVSVGGLRREARVFRHKV